MRAQTLIVSLIYFLYGHGYAQEIVFNVQPTMYVHYQDNVNLADSLVIYFFTSNHTKSGTGKFAFIAEFNLKNQHLTVDTIVNTDGFRMLGTSYEMYVLQASDSILIAATNNFDCDVIYSEVASLDLYGQGKWKMNFDAHYMSIQAIGMIKSDVIAIKQSTVPTIYFDLDGNEVFPDTPPDIYFNTLQIGSYWHGTHDNMLYKLDDAFNVVDTYVSDSIRYIRGILNSRIIIGTNSDITIIDTFFNVIANASIISMDADAYDSKVWVVSEDGLSLLDSNLEVVKIFPIIPFEKIQTVNAFLDEVFVLSEYDGIYHKDFVIRKYSEKDTAAHVSLDLAIESIQLPDNIILEHWNGLPYANILYFDSISFIVRNNSNHPIESCNINYDWDTDAWCVGNYWEWHFDSIHIMPSDIGILTVKSYLTGVIFSSIDNRLCFWVDYPNRMPDQDPSNDYLCEYGNIISRTDNVTKGNIKIFPNPATDYIYFENDGQAFQPLTAYIYDITGIILNSIRIDSYPTEFAVTEMPAGMYFIRLIDREKNVDTRKLVITH